MSLKPTHEYTILTFVYYKKDDTSYVQYRGRVMGSQGYWVVSKDFDSRTEAELWCKSKQEYAGTLPPK